MISRVLQFGGRTNPVQVKGNTGLTRVSGALGVPGVETEKREEFGGSVWDPHLESLSARLSGLDFIH